MGRKGNYKERVKSGPGRKTKKQGEPTFSAELALKAADPNKKLSSRQKKRLKKRELKPGRNEEKNEKDRRLEN